MKKKSKAKLWWVLSVAATAFWVFFYFNRSLVNPHARGFDEVYVASIFISIASTIIAVISTLTARRTKKSESENITDTKQATSFSLKLVLKVLLWWALPVAVILYRGHIWYNVLSENPYSRFYSFIYSVSLFLFIILIIVAVILSFVTILGAVKLKKAEGFYQAGLAAMDRKDYKAAQDYFMKAEDGKYKEANDKRMEVIHIMFLEEKEKLKKELIENVRPYVQKELELRTKAENGDAEAQYEYALFLMDDGRPINKHITDVDLWNKNTKEFDSVDVQEFVYDFVHDSLTSPLEYLHRFVTVNTSIEYRECQNMFHKYLRECDPNGKFLKSFTKTNVKKWIKAAKDQGHEEASAFYRDLLNCEKFKREQAKFARESDEYRRKQALEDADFRAKINKRIDNMIADTFDMNANRTGSSSYSGSGSPSPSYSPSNSISGGTSPSSDYTPSPSLSDKTILFMAAVSRGSVVKENEVIVMRNAGGTILNEHNQPLGRVAGNTILNENSDQIGFIEGDVVLKSGSTIVGRIEGSTILNANSERIGRIE